jgi:hypothetical protein
MTPPPLPISRLIGKRPFEFGLAPAPDGTPELPYAAIRGLTKRSQQLLDQGSVQLVKGSRVLVATEEAGWLRFVIGYSETQSHNKRRTTPLAIGPEVRDGFEGEDPIERALFLADQLAGHAAWNATLSAFTESDEPVRSALLFKIVASCKETLESGGIPLAPGDQLISDLVPDFKGWISTVLSRFMTGIIKHLNDLFGI